MKNLQQKIYTYFERDPELRVLFIFDNGFKRDELQDVEWKEGFLYVEFKGDWFTTKYKLEHDWKDLKVILIFQQASPNEYKNMRESFPLMDCLVANMEYHDLDYVAFIQQYGLPESMASFVSRNIDLLQTEKFLRLFAPDFKDGSFTEDKAVRGFISSFLGSTLVLDWNAIFVKLFLLGKDEKKLSDFFRRLGTCPSAKLALEKKAVEIFGVSLSDYTINKFKKLVEVMKYNSITQLLSPVQADNYRALRINDALSLQSMNQILELALSNPRTAVPFTEIIASYGADVHDEDIISWYGTDANYFFVPEALITPIIKNLVNENIVNNPEKVVEKLEDLILKHNDNGPMRSVIAYLTIAANFFLYVKDCGSFMLNSPQQFVDKYEKTYYQIDMLYRQSLESYFGLEESMPLYDLVVRVKKHMDLDYHKVANRLNLEWMRCLRDMDGFKSITNVRQQNFYDEYLKNINKKQVVIISDALRYEVAHELISVLQQKKHSATLEAGLAMLPTETKFCKQAFLPHQSLDMVQVKENEVDMEVDGKILSSTSLREQQLAKYKESVLAITYKELMAMDAHDRYECFKRQLVFIYHDTIDNDSHDGEARKMVRASRQAIEDLKKLVPWIHDKGNVTKIYITADHGFLFNDIPFEEKDKLPVEEETIERKTRYYLTKSKEEKEGITKFPLSEVSGMSQDIMVAVPNGTNRLKAPSGGYAFAHGGAALQEIIIPIYISSYEEYDNKEPVRVSVLKRNLTMTASRLKFTLIQVDAVSMEQRKRTVVCGIYNGDELVTKQQRIEINKQDASLEARQYTVDLTLNKNVDAKVLELRIYDEKDMMNPLDKLNVINKTSIDLDF